MSLFKNSSDSLKTFFILSCAAHLGLAILVVWRGTGLFSPPKTYLPSLRVDLVALPDLKKTDVPPLPTEQPAPPAPAEKDQTEKNQHQPELKNSTDGEISTQKKKSLSSKEREAQEKLKNALNRIKALERIKAMAGAPVRGNQISKGSSLTGDAKISLETTYFDVVLERVRNYWELPKWLRDQAHLSAQVTVFIDRRGQITKTIFVKSSGNNAFDQEVKRTLQASAPFPEPPIAIIPDLAQEGILLGFPM